MIVQWCPDPQCFLHFKQMARARHVLFYLIHMTQYLICIPQRKKVMAEHIGHMGVIQPTWTEVSLLSKHHSTNLCWAPNMCPWRRGDPLETVSSDLRIVLPKDYDMCVSNSNVKWLKTPKSSCIETTYQRVSVKNSVWNPDTRLFCNGDSAISCAALPASACHLSVQPPWVPRPGLCTDLFAMKQAFCKMQFPLAQSALPSLEEFFLFACFNSFVEI